MCPAGTRIRSFLVLLNLTDDSNMQLVQLLLPVPTK